MIFQLNSALLDTCVLSVLNKGDTYGYVLTQKIRSVVPISESTLYPVLRRLQKDEYLTTYDQEQQGRNRRYYQITKLGKKKFLEYQKEWIRHKDALDSLIIGDENHE